MKHIFLRFVVITALLSFFSTLSFAMQPTAAQIEQFKRLPAAQQKALAQQYGINLSGHSPSAQPSFNDTATNKRVKKQTTAAEQNIESQAQKATDEIVLAEKQAKTSTKERLKQFGYDLFDDGEQSFSPVVDSAIPNDYIMGPGDSLIIQLYGKENASHSLTINREGQIQFPDIGPINLAGLKFSQVQTLLTQTVEEQMIGVKSSITMGNLRTIRVFVLGDVKQPGSFIVSSLSTMTNALFASGGVSKIGSLRNIQLKRRGRIITRLDLYDLLLKGDTRGDQRLLPGDVLFVPTIGKTAGISGEVRRPAIYELKNERNVGELIKLAGGLRPRAHLESSRIERINKQGELTIVDLDLTKQANYKKAIQEADVLQIFPVLDEMENIVLLEGHVKRPGPAAWFKGMRFSDLVDSVNDLLPNPDTNIAIIEREIPESRLTKAVSVNVLNAINNPGSKWDVFLQPRDTITLLNYQNDRQAVLGSLIKKLQIQSNRTTGKQLVSISGHIKFPGEYPLLDNMTSQQLIQIAGGLTENAYSLSAELSRYSLDGNQVRNVEHIDVNLSDVENYRLQSEDKIRIKQIPRWVGNETVTITGEVAFPGTYTIKRGETLSNLIQRAGGITEQGYTNGAVFTRLKLKKLEAQRLQELQQRLEADIAAANIEQQDTTQRTTSADAERVLENLSALKPIGRMVINLTLILSSPKEHDVVLSDGDSLNIPKIKQSVTVIGEVQYPTSHIYDASLDPQDYISRSGGTNDRADKKRIYIVKADGSVYLPKKKGWFKREKNNIEPGDTIVIPLDAERIKPLTLWTSASQIFYQIALGAAAVASF